jgi:hypothetical protein
MTNFFEYIGIAITGVAAVIGLVFLVAVGGALGGFILGWVLNLTPLGPIVEQGLGFFIPGIKGSLPQFTASISFVAGLVGGHFRPSSIRVKQETERR